MTKSIRQVLIALSAVVFIAATAAALSAAERSWLMAGFMAGVVATAAILAARPLNQGSQTGRIDQLEWQVKDILRRLRVLDRPPPPTPSSGTQAISTPIGRKDGGAS